MLTNYRTLTILCGLLVGTGSALAEIEVNEYVSLQGFIDTSYTWLDSGNRAFGTVDEDRKEKGFNIEEVELVSLFTYESLSARLDIEYEDGDDLPDIEQAFLSFQSETSSSVSTFTVGRYASMLGFEAYEPVGMYQYSNAYGDILSDFFNAYMAAASLQLGVVDDSDLSVFFESLLLPVAERYSQGLRYTFEDAEDFFGLSLNNGTVNYDNRTRGNDERDDMAVYDQGYSIELAYARRFMRIVTLFLGGSYESGEGLDTYGTSTGDTSTWVLNSYLTCELGAWLFAAEFNFSETEIEDFFDSGRDAAVESMSGLVMANYAYNASGSVTGRVSYTRLDFDSRNFFVANGHGLKYTLAHNYGFGDQVFLVTEMSYSAADLDSFFVGARDPEELFLAAEVLVQF